MTELQALGAFLGVLFTGLLGWFGLRQKQDESKAGARVAVEEILNAGVHHLIGELQEELGRVRTIAERREGDYLNLYDKQRALEDAVATQTRELIVVKGQVTMWANGVRFLTAQIRELGHDPIWVADEHNKETP